MDQATGLRERKKQRTRDAIARAALELFAERGYQETTLAEIAEAADVSTRTIFAYFPSKEDILFCDYAAMRDALARALAERPGGKDALGTLHDFILTAVHEMGELEAKLERVIATDETLHSHKRARLAQLQELLAAAIADDLETAPTTSAPTSPPPPSPPHSRRSTRKAKPRPRAAGRTRARPRCGSRGDINPPARRFAPRRLLPS
jgi:AcrR family transcriptional regulator